MPLRLSTGARNALAGTIGSWFDSGTLIIYGNDGTGQPASPDTAPTGAGTVLATISLPADAFEDPGSGEITLKGSWVDSSADATGTAAWFRFIASGDTNTASTTAIRIDGSVSGQGGGGELELVSTSLTAGQPVQILSAKFTVPAAES